MTNATATKVVPTGTTVTRAASAVLAAEKLSAALTGAKGAASAYIVSQYGADIDTTAVRLAKRAADEVSGSAKSKGGNRAAVLAVLAIVGDADPLTDKVLVAAARAALDAEAARKRARTAEKRALADTINDAAAPVDSRHAALDILTGMDEADKAATRVEAEKRFNAAMLAAVNSGVSFEYMTKSLTALIKSAKSAN